jgi:hypothetical protein
MVAAIVIPLIFLYFLYITIKERKQQYSKWLNLEHVKEEAYLSGKVIQVSRNEKFIGKHLVSITTLLLQDKVKVHKAVRKLPKTNSFHPFTIEEGTYIRCYGYWDQDLFIFNRYNIMGTKKSASAPK